ncbi:MAG: hypothetical protein AB7O62_13680 [Pirellulales bacterium]
MKLALLGCDSEMLGVARAAVDAGDQIVWFHDAGEHAGELRRIAPRAIAADAWEGLLAQNEVEAVLVARGDEELRADQLRKLAQEGLALLVSHPVVESMLLYYELEMIRGEQQTLLVPCLPMRLHPAVVRLQALAGEGNSEGVGRLEQVTLERSLADCQRHQVLVQFARDADLARALCGELNKLTATASPDESARYSSLTVQLAGMAGAAVRWSVEPASAGNFLRITLRGSRGKAALTLNEERPDAVTGRMEYTSDGTQRVENFAAWSGNAMALDVFHQAVAGQPPSPDWIDAARSVELAETIDRSLRKGRTIELHFEDYSEEATFKGTMTSLGCGLLMLGLILLFVAALAARAGVSCAGYYLYGLLAVLGLFLLLQLFKFVFPPE